MHAMQSKELFWKFQSLIMLTPVILELQNVTVLLEYIANILECTKVTETSRYVWRGCV